VVSWIHARECDRRVWGSDSLNRPPAERSVPVVAEHGVEVVLEHDAFEPALERG
jgi:hypothetical protein